MGKDYWTRMKDGAKAGWRESKKVLERKESLPNAMDRVKSTVENSSQKKK